MQCLRVSISQHLHFQHFQHLFHPGVSATCQLPVPYRYGPRTDLGRGICAWRCMCVCHINRVGSVTCCACTSVESRTRLPTAHAGVVSDDVDATSGAPQHDSLLGPTSVVLGRKDSRKGMGTSSRGATVLTPFLWGGRRDGGGVGGGELPQLALLLSGNLGLRVGSWQGHVSSHAAYGVLAMIGRECKGCVRPPRASQSMCMCMCKGCVRPPRGSQQRASQAAGAQLVMGSDDRMECDRFALPGACTHRHATLELHHLQLPRRHVELLQTPLWAAVGVDSPWAERDVNDSDEVDRRMVATRGCEQPWE